MRRKKNITQEDGSVRMYTALDMHKVYSQVAVDDEDGGSPARREIEE